MPEIGPIGMKCGQHVKNNKKYADGDQLPTKKRQQVSKLCNEHAYLNVYLHIHMYAAEVLE